MVATSYGWIKDPAPFLQFFLSVGVTSILGASTTAVMNSWKTTSQAESQHLEEHKTGDYKAEERQEVSYTETQKIERPRFYDSGEIDYLHIHRASFNAHEFLRPKNVPKHKLKDGLRLFCRIYNRTIEHIEEPLSARIPYSPLAEGERGCHGVPARILLLHRRRMPD